MNIKDCKNCGKKIPYKKRKDAEFCSSVCCYRFRLGTKNPHGKQDGRSKKEDYHKNRARKRYIKINGENGRFAKARELGYRSMFEVRVVSNMVDKNLPFEYEPMKVPYQITSIYKPDFRLPNGVLIEAKGRFTSSDRRKMVAVKKCNPELDIRFLFQNASTRLTKNKNSEMYRQWAERLGFIWAEGDKIPLEWWK